MSSKFDDRKEIRAELKDLAERLPQPQNLEELAEMHDSVQLIFEWFDLDLA